MAAEIRFKCKKGDGLETRKIFSFSFAKEIYTPYTQISAVFDGEGLIPEDCTEVFFYIDERLVHHGLPDQVKVIRENGAVRGTVSSRGFTSLLLENQLAPGFYMNLSINSLVDDFFRIPNITHEDSSADSGYIYVKSSSVMWDGVVNLAYKLNRQYPYIRGTNRIMISPVEDRILFVYGDDYLTSAGSEMVSKKISSDFHMGDLSGNYGSFDYTFPDAKELNIVRHKYFELDKRFLYDPDSASEYRGMLASRGWRRIFCSYNGYSGEDLGDELLIEGAGSGTISRVKVTGDEKGIQTELSIYRDMFYKKPTEWDA